MNGSNFLQASQRVKYNHTSLEEMGEGRGGEGSIVETLSS